MRVWLMLLNLRRLIAAARRRLAPGAQDGAVQSTVQLASPRPDPAIRTNDTARKQWDFFISYASEDRGDGAVPLADALTRRHFSVWLDQIAINKNDQLEDQIIGGLRHSRWGIVLLSKHFLRKDWPKRELDILLALEQIDARSRIIFVRHNLTFPELKDAAPRIADRARITTEGDIERACDEVLAVRHGN